MKPKIIFFDIDGTLVPLKESIRPRTVEALQKLRQMCKCLPGFPHKER